MSHTMSESIAPRMAGMSPRANAPYKLWTRLTFCCDIRLPPSACILFVYAVIIRLIPTATSSMPKKRCISIGENRRFLRKRHGDFRREVGYSTEFSTGEHEQGGSIRDRSAQNEKANDDHSLHSSHT